jgi:acetamidase/formamidase
VAYGYYWSEAKPVLRIASGDIIDVDTMLTNTPTGLSRAGVPDAKIQASLTSIVTEVTGDRKGPGGHILTGPVYVDGAEPGDVLEVKILSIDLALDYGYNGCSGYPPDNCEKDVPVKILALNRQKMTAAFHAVHDLASKKRLYMRDAAYVIAVQRVAQSCRDRGWV